MVGTGKKIIKEILLVVVSIALGFSIATLNWYLRLPTGAERLNENVEIVLQSKGYTCGPASLVMVLEAYGIEASEEEIASLAGTIPGKGTAMYGLKKAAEALGLEMVGVRLSMHTLKIVNKPLIAYLGHHNVVVLKIEDDKIQIIDPAFGKTWMESSKFKNRWQGYALVPVKRTD